MRFASPAGQLPRLVRTFLTLSAIVALYVFGMVAGFFAAVETDSLHRVEARKLAKRIPVGSSVAEVHAIVGRPPDRVTGDGTMYVDEDHPSRTSGSSATVASSLDSAIGV